MEHIITTRGNFVFCKTPRTLLVLEVVTTDLHEDTPLNGRKYVVQNYYGPAKESFVPSASECIANRGSSADEYNLGNLITTTFGTGNNQETSLLLRNPDGTNINRFDFREFKVLKGGVACKGPHARSVDETLEIIEEDKTLDLELRTYYSFFRDSDVILAKRELVNRSKKHVEINRIFSLECPIPSRDLTVSTYDGKWLFERTRHQTRLTSGVYFIDSKFGSSSHKHNPFIQVKDNTNGLFYAFNFIYSGNHRETVEVNSLFHSSVYVGINDFGFAYPLEGGESFLTPEAVFCLGSSDEETTKEMHRFVLNHIVDPKFHRSPRPIIFNNWEGTGMAIDEKSLSEMALIAKGVGVEQFVMDDGWFYGRTDDKAGLGDWFIDREKFPNGLGKFADYVRGFGLKFGLWFEPEMICKNTKLFREHPEFACIIPNREPLEKRHQLVIDMANPKVVDYLYACIKAVLEETKAEYVKWDYNRYFTDCYSHAPLKGDYAYHFIQGTYSLIERLQEDFPDILFESCASGGGRYDLGMMYYMPQTWGSDDTNAYCRCFIACGTLSGYPQSTYGAHVAIDGSPIEGRQLTSSLEDRFNLHSCGAFGYEFDFRKRTEKELETIAKQIAFYKEHRMLFQYGQYIISDNCFDDARYYSYTLLGEQAKEAMMFVAELEENVPSKRWKAKGLDPEAVYEVAMRPQTNLLEEQIYRGKATGRSLMEEGLDLGSLHSTTDQSDYHGIFSRLLYLKKEN